MQAKHCIERLPINKQATELRNACDNEGWFSGVTMFEDQVNYYNKQIWFIRALLG